MQFISAIEISHLLYEDLTKKEIAQFPCEVYINNYLIKDLIKINYINGKSKYVVLN